MVRYAREHGMKPAAREYKLSVRIVRKWVGRYDGTLKSLKDRSRAPHRRPRKISPELEQKIVSLKRKLPTWGAERLKRDFNLPCSAKAILRVYRQYGLIRRIRPRHKAKRDLRAIKQSWRVFQQICVDTKDLRDIPEYWPAMNSYSLPKFQYTARDVTSGLVFLGYAKELSLTHATIFIDRVLDHLRSCGVDTTTVTIQTDNGSEFIGSWQQKGPSSFTKVVEQKYRATHKTIPPGAHTFQSDVETFHSIVQHEFYQIESFHGPNDFFNKMATYHLVFNYARTNSYKGFKTPMQIIKERNPSFHPAIGFLPPLNLDALLPAPYKPHTQPHPSLDPKRGHLLWSYPSNQHVPSRQHNPGSGITRCRIDISARIALTTAIAHGHEHTAQGPLSQ